MPDDAIKAALRAAAVEHVAKGMQSLLPDEPGIYEMWKAEPLTEQAVRHMACAIAVFLRALPHGMIRWGDDRNGYDVDDKPTLKKFAKAVERAGGS